MIDPKDERLKVGAWVIYREHRPEPRRDALTADWLRKVCGREPVDQPPDEDGTISSLQALGRDMVHVRFGHGQTGKACHLRDLYWPAAVTAPPAPTEKRRRS
jgi:hypothetical protein